MRRLGQELGVEAMSLYNHVANKEDLLDGMVDVVVAEIEPPTAPAPIGGRLRAARPRGPRGAAAPSLGVAGHRVAVTSRPR